MATGLSIGTAWSEAAAFVGHPRLPGLDEELGVQRGVLVEGPLQYDAAVDPAVAAEGAGFGGAASAWWQSHRGSFVCDGKRHVGWFTVDTVEPGSRGELGPGWGWVQFCVTTDEDLSAVRMQWSRVVTNR